MFNTGDIVKVINPRNGCFGARNIIGKVTKRESTNGLSPSEGTINIETNIGIWRVNEDGCELFQRSKIPAIESLIGKIIVCRNGDEYLVCESLTGKIFGTGEEGYIYLDSYDEDFKTQLDEFDIMEIKYPLVGIFSDLGKNKEIIWKRKEAKEMTIREIEAALGYSVKIIKEEGC